MSAEQFSRSFAIRPEQAKAAMKFFAKTDMRQYLNGACVKVVAGALSLCATDGHRAIIMDIRADHSGDGVKIIIMPFGC